MQLTLTYTYCLQPGAKRKIKTITDISADIYTVEPYFTCYAKAYNKGTFSRLKPFSKVALASIKELALHLNKDFFAK